MHDDNGTRESVRVVAPKRSPITMWVKRAVQCVFFILTLPRLLSYRMGHQLLGNRAFGAASESIARIPGLRGVYLRQAFYRSTLQRCGQDIYFGWQSALSMTEAAIGDRAYIGRFCSIGFADIGEEVMLADHVQILSGGREHEFSSDGETTIHEQAQTFHRVKIGRGAWIGAGAVIMADVGEGSVIGAGAVVNQPVPAQCVAVGVPAHVVKQLRGRASVHSTTALS